MKARRFGYPPSIPVEVFAGLAGDLLADCPNMDAALAAAMEALLDGARRARASQQQERNRK